MSNETQTPEIIETGEDALVAIMSEDGHDGTTTVEAIKSVSEDTYEKGVNYGRSLTVLQRRFTQEKDATPIQVAHQAAIGVRNHAIQIAEERKEAWWTRGLFPAAMEVVKSLKTNDREKEKKNKKSNTMTSVRTVSMGGKGALPERRFTIAQTNTRQNSGEEDKAFARELSAAAQALNDFETAYNKALEEQTE